MAPKSLSALDRCLGAVPLPLVRLAAPRHLITLMYHLVSPEPVAHVSPIYPSKTPEAFENDLRFIRRHFRAVEYEELREAREGGAELAAGSAMVTFDDGFRQCHTQARPLLARHGVPCTFFVVTDCIDNRSLMFRNKAALVMHHLGELPRERVAEVLARFAQVYGVTADSLDQVRRWVDRTPFPERSRLDAACEVLEIDVARYLAQSRPYMSADEILELHRAGHTIGAHTLSHPQLWLVGEGELTRQIVGSCAAIRDLTGQKSVPLAFPFNGRPLHRGRLEKLRAANPVVGLLFDTNNLMRDREFVVNRVDCDPPTGGAESASNLPLLLKRAHALEPARRFKRWLSAVRE